MVTDELKIPIFDGEDFEFWMIKMKTTVVSYDLWTYIDQGYTVSDVPEYDLTVNQRLELKKNIKKDAKALGIIQNAITAKIFTIM